MKLAAVVALIAFSALSGNAATKVFVMPIETNYPTNWYSIVSFYDTTSQNFVWNKVVFFPKDNSILTTNDAIAYTRAAAYTEATNQGYTITDADFIANWPITGLSTPSTPTFNNPTRTLNSAFQISSTQPARVSYAVSIAATLSLTTGQSGTVVLEYADDSGFTTNVKTVQSSINGNTGSLTIGLNLVQTVTATIAGEVPAAKYVRLRTVNNTSTPTFTFVSAQEVLY